MSRVLVTGLGVVTSLACEAEALQAALLEGRLGLSAPRRRTLRGAPLAAVAEVPEATLARLRAEDPALAAEPDLRALLAAGAARCALADAGLPPAPPGRGGVALASGARAPGVAGLWSGPGGGRAATDPESGLPATVEPATLLAARHGARGPVLAPLCAFASGAQALGLALRALRRGEADWMLAGGVDARLDPLGVAGFARLGVLAPAGGAPERACRPFDRRRRGTALAEGAAVVLLETEAYARARGARPRAELAGYGATLDAYQAAAPCPDGRGVAAAMRRALGEAGLAPEEVDLVSAHATGTRLGDPAEVAAVRAVFGAHAARLAVPGLKSMLGHLLAASGPVAFVSSVLSVEHDAVPPTATLSEPDPACDLDHVPGRGRPQPVRAALVNASGFGGANVSLALRRWPAGSGARG